MLTTLGVLAIIILAAVIIIPIAAGIYAFRFYRKNIKPELDGARRVFDQYRN